MKKKWLTGHPYEDSLKKLVRIMRLIFLFLLGCILTVSANSYAQKTKLDINMTNTTIRDLFSFIEDKSDFIFLYRNEDLNISRKVDVILKNATINQILDQALKDDDVVYNVYERQIVIQKAIPTENDLKQQLKDIKGGVFDKEGKSIPGVSVIIKGTTIGTITDSEGKFSFVNLGSNAQTLVFSYIGMITKELEIDGKQVFSVVLEESTFNIDEVVAVGYGTQKKSDLTGAVVRIDAESFKSQPMTQITDMLTGTIAGMYTNQGTSAEGGSSIIIRGQKSLNASTNPMIVIDGAIFGGNVSEINPADIETIDILKDASSAAVYGSQAASGVILITTKKGKTDVPTINFSTSVGVANPTHDFKPYDGAGYLKFRRDYLRTINSSKASYYYDNPNNLPVGVSLQDWRNASNNPQEDNINEYLNRLGFFQVEVDNYNTGKEVNWYNEVIRPGIRQNYDLSISGATDRVNYYWSIGYQNNEGVILGDKFGTIRSRLNLDINVTDWMDVGINSQFSHRNQNVASEGALWWMDVNSPYGSKYNEDGSLNWYPNSYTAVQNPLLNYYGQDRLMNTDDLFTTLYTKIKLPFNIEYKMSFQPSFSFLKDYNFWSSNTITGGQDHSQGYGTRTDASSFGWILDHLVHWQKEVGIHNFDLTLLYSAEESKSWSSTMSNETFVPNQNLGFSGLQFGTKPGISNNDQKSTGDAAMARLNYIMMGKYLFTASIRRDGYSAFGLKNPRAIFPAIALAWKISEEEFFKVGWVSQLKARASWGVNGNRAIGNYSALAQLNPIYYYNGSNTQVGVYNSTLANSNLKWERSQSLNFGVDLGMFDNRISIVAEYYDVTTNDLLMNRLLPPITGFTNVTSNLGELGNKGFEFTLNTVNINKTGFSWRSGLVFSFNRNKIKKLFSDYETVEVDGQTVTREIPDYTNEWFPGQAIDRVWNYNVTGIWQENEATEAAKYGLAPGDYKAEDVDGNYIYEVLVDKQFIGYKKPRYQFGFKNDFTFLKNFSALIFIRADLGQIGEFSQALRTSSETYDKRSVYDFPYWTPENPINDYPRLSTRTEVFDGGLKIYKPMSFLRVQDISLTYQLPTDICKILKLDGVRIFYSGRNMLTFSKWPGWDPESGDAPMPKISTVGINISL